MNKFPHLLSYAKSTIISVHDFLHVEFLEDNFHLPLSHQAFYEFLVLEERCQEFRHDTQEETHDNWNYIWGSDKFEVKKAYSAMIGHSPSPPHFSWVWATSCQNKHKFFFWLLLLDRLNTRNLMMRKNFNLPDYNCVTSNCITEESANHLF